MEVCPQSSLLIASHSLTIGLVTALVIASHSLTIGLVTDLVICVPVPLEVWLEGGAKSPVIDSKMLERGARN